MDLDCWNDDIILPLGWIASLSGYGLSPVSDKIIADDLKLKPLVKKVKFGLHK
jgi:hypothetical protein